MPLQPQSERTWICVYMWTEIQGCHQVSPSIALLKYCGSRVSGSQPDIEIANQLVYLASLLWECPSAHWVTGWQAPCTPTHRVTLGSGCPNSASIVYVQALCPLGHLSSPSFLFDVSLSVRILPGPGTFMILYIEHILPWFNIFEHPHSDCSSWLPCLWRGSITLSV